MELSSLDGRDIGEFGSKNATWLEIIRTDKVAVGVMRFGPGGLLGNHAGRWNQRFAVLEGEGWVRTGESEVRPVKKGDSVDWGAGEMHESGSDDGMTVVIVQTVEPLMS